jgi:hypothetical protein
MAINFSTDLLAKCFDVFARPITVTPIVSQPNQAAYSARAYFDSMGLDVLTEEGSIFSDSKTFIDLRIAEFPVLPKQGDLITMSPHAGMRGGQWEVLDLDGEGDAKGMISVTLRKIVTPTP